MPACNKRLFLKADFRKKADGYVTDTVNGALDSGQGSRVSTPYKREGRNTVTGIPRVHRALGAVNLGRPRLYWLGPGLYSLNSARFHRG